MKEKKEFGCFSMAFWLVKSMAPDYLRLYLALPHDATVISIL